METQSEHRNCNHFRSEEQRLMKSTTTRNSRRRTSSSRNLTKRDGFSFARCLVGVIAAKIQVAHPFMVTPLHVHYKTPILLADRIRVNHPRSQQTSTIKCKSINPNQQEGEFLNNDSAMTTPSRQNGINFSDANNYNTKDGSEGDHMVAGNSTDDPDGIDSVEDSRYTKSTSPPSPDRAISIVSELKSNAALFAAFAYGSLNLPSTLTVSESKVTSVTTSLSISRPLPESDLIRTFVVLDVCTLCLMISCVAASQLLIYRLTDGSYEDLAEDKYDETDARNSALGRLVTTYRNEFTIARITFDLGLVTLLLAVGVRSLAIFDEDIVVPVAVVLGVTALFLVIAYLTTYVEVFRTAENLTQRPLFSIAFPFLTKDSDKMIVSDKSDPGLNQLIPQIFLPISLLSVGLALFVSLTEGSGLSTDSNLSRLGPYDVTSGAVKLKVVTEKIDSERGKLDSKAKSDRKKARAEAEAARKKAEEDSKKRAEDEAKKKAEAEAKKKVEEEAKKKAELEAKKKAEEEAQKKAEAKRKLEAEAQKQAEEEAKKKAEAQAVIRAEVEAKKKAEEVRKKAEQEAIQKAEEAAAAELKAKEAAREAIKNKLEETSATEAKVKEEEATTRLMVTVDDTLTAVTKTSDAIAKH